MGGLGKTDGREKKPPRHRRSRSGKTDGRVSWRDRRPAIYTPLSLYPRAQHRQTFWFFLGTDNLGRSATEAQLGFDCEHEFKFGVELEFSLEFEFEFEVGFELECEFEFGLELEFKFEFGFEFELECEFEFEFELEPKFSFRSKMKSEMISK